MCKIHSRSEKKKQVEIGPVKMKELKKNGEEEEDEEKENEGKEEEEEDEEVTSSDSQSSNETRGNIFLLQDGVKGCMLTWTRRRGTRRKDSDLYTSSGIGFYSLLFA